MGNEDLDSWDTGLSDGETVNARGVGATGRSAEF